MTGAGGDDAFIIRQHGGDDHGIGLGSAYEEEHIRLRKIHGFPDFLLRTGAVGILSVAGQRLQIRLRQGAEDLRMRSGVIIADK